MTMITEGKRKISDELKLKQSLLSCPAGDFEEEFWLHWKCGQQPSGILDRWDHLTHFLQVWRTLQETLYKKHTLCAKVSLAPFMGRQDVGKKQALDGRCAVMQSNHKDTEQPFVASTNDKQDMAGHWLVQRNDGKQTRQNRLAPSDCTRVRRVGRHLKQDRSSSGDSELLWVNEWPF